MQAFRQDTTPRTWHDAERALQRQGLPELEILEELAFWTSATPAALMVLEHRRSEEMKARPEFYKVLWTASDALRELLQPTLGYNAVCKPDTMHAGKRGLVHEIQGLRHGRPAVVTLLLPDEEKVYPRTWDLWCVEGERRRQDLRKKEALLKHGLDYVDEDGELIRGRVVSVSTCPRPKTNIGMRVRYVPEGATHHEFVLLDDVKVADRLLHV